MKNNSFLFVGKNKPAKNIIGIFFPTLFSKGLQVVIDLRLLNHLHFVTNPAVSHKEDK